MVDWLAGRASEGVRCLPVKGVDYNSLQIQEADDHPSGHSVDAAASHMRSSFPIQTDLGG